MKPLETQYEWLEHENGPRILIEALKLYGTIEGPGDKNNPVILGWAQEIGGWIADFYGKDEIPWCGLFIAVCAKRAGHPFNQKALSAKSWIDWGARVAYPMLGDVVMFSRKGGGHVGLYVGEDAEAYHILGGNQGDAVTITRIDKDRLFAARRTAFKYKKPANVRRVFLSPQGKLSQNES